MPATETKEKSGKVTAAPRLNGNDRMSGFRQDPGQDSGQEAFPESSPTPASSAASEQAQSEIAVMVSELRQLRSLL